MSNQELASVIIPCYNQAHFLSEAIKSVFSQSHRDYEVIVVDDGSSDDTWCKARSFDRVRCLRQENRGVASARNAGLAASNGSYIVFLDADDRLFSNALSVGIDSLKSNPDCAFSYGHIIPISTDGSLLTIPFQAAVRANHYLELLRHNYIWTTGAVVYRRDILEAVCGFNESTNGSADFDLNVRITRRFPIVCSDESVLAYRQHDQSMSRDYALMLQNAIGVRRAQRRFVKGKKALETALRTGIRSVQDDYGEKLIDVVGSNLRERDWRKAAAGLLILLRYYPQGVFKRARAKLKRLVDGTSKLTNQFGS